jgi:hypothetical protein
MERLECENTILHHGTHESTETDLELQIVYHSLSEAKHGWNFTRQQLDLAREEVDTRTHGIMHLENVIEMQDTELKERAEMIFNHQDTTSSLIACNLGSNPAYKKNGHGNKVLVPILFLIGGFHFNHLYKGLVTPFVTMYDNQDCE